MKWQFKLRFPTSEIRSLAKRYRYQDDGDVRSIGRTAKLRGYFTRDEFLHLCRWKTPRSKKRCAANSAEFVEEITATALSTRCEQLRIEILLLLRGVSWPTASVILHFAARQPYPILDFRALWSLGISAPARTYDFDLWRQYTSYCRRLIRTTGAQMRTLDRALWQFSKEHQTR